MLDVRVRQTVQKPSKIQCGSRAARRFVGSVHKAGFDRGALLTLGNNCRVEQAFTDSPSAMDRALAALPAQVGQNRNEHTRFFDSLWDTSQYVWRNALRDRMKGVVVVVDGQDDRSVLFRANPRGLGQKLAETFTRDPNNFLFLIGVGTGEQIDKKALSAIGEAGRFPTYFLDSFHRLEEVFVRIAFRMTRVLRTTWVHGENFIMEVPEELIVIERRPMDYAILLDCSSSMKAVA